MANEGTIVKVWVSLKEWLGVERSANDAEQDAPGRESVPAVIPAEVTEQKSAQERKQQSLDQVDKPGTSNIIDEIDQQKAELDAMRPLPSDVVGRVEQKLRIESNYHSNAIEGNSLTLGETKSLILHGLTAHGKSMRDHLDVEGHDEAVKAMEDAVNRNEFLNEVFIRNLHKVLLKEPYEIDALTPNGRPTKRLINVGQYKTQPNNVETSTGEIYYYTSPDQVKPEMSDLMDWYRSAESQGEHPIVIAATFHYRFVRIHPFDDGNGRMARLLMNLILIKHGYTVAIIPIQERNRYIDHLEQADKSEDLAEFIAYVAGCCEYTLSLHLRAARGEDIEEADDIDKEIALFKRSLKTRTNDLIQARDYADSVLYPLFQHCNKKLGQFSEVFESVNCLTSDTSVTVSDYQTIAFPLMEEGNTWPEQATSISIYISFELRKFQGRQSANYDFRIENKADSDGYAWKFYGDFSNALSGDEITCRGRDLEVLKKTFNDLVRRMIKKLSEISDDR